MIPVNQSQSVSGGDTDDRPALRGPISCETNAAHATEVVLAGAETKVVQIKRYGNRVGELRTCFLFWSHYLLMMNLFEQSASLVAHNGLLVNWPFDSDAHPPTANWDLINEARPALMRTATRENLKMNDRPFCFASLCLNSSTRAAHSTTAGATADALDEVALVAVTIVSQQMCCVTVYPGIRHYAVGTTPPSLALYTLRSQRLA
ncbi:unnamed protein product [Pleuronectes platessa]|uniref:Uncharacterized protein n=1 Tax=Pleuronectes platessa TaxID=8262 RepID=A0A9N7W362_PLEPL|nr:unnamed protein product [Pleuronectes platessa]